MSGRVNVGVIPSRRWRTCRGAHRVAVHAQIGRDGADVPVLGVVQTTDRGELFRVQHFSSREWVDQHAGAAVDATDDLAYASIGERRPRQSQARETDPGVATLIRHAPRNQPAAVFPLAIAVVETSFGTSVGAGDWPHGAAHAVPCLDIAPSSSAARGRNDRTGRTPPRTLRPGTGAGGAGLARRSRSAPHGRTRHTTAVMESFSAPIGVRLPCGVTHKTLVARQDGRGFASTPAARKPTASRRTALLCAMNQGVAW